MLNLFWPYPSTNSISDQIWFIRKLCEQHFIPFTISNRLDPISHNLCLENFNDQITSQIRVFCEKHKSKISVVLTEFFELAPNGAYIVNGHHHQDVREYNNQEIKYRFKNLEKLVPYISSFLSLGGVPYFDHYSEAFGITNCFDFGLPELNFYPQAVEHKDFDLYFSGSMTQYRSDFIDRLKECGFSILVEKSLVSESERRRNLLKCSFNLNITQDADWQWLSIMRVIFAARFGKYTLSNIGHDSSYNRYLLSSFNRSELFEEFHRKNETAVKKIDNVYGNFSYSGFKDFISKLP